MTEHYTTCTHREDSEQHFPSAAAAAYISICAIVDSAGPESGEQNRRELLALWQKLFRTRHPSSALARPALSSILIRSFSTPSAAAAGTDVEGRKWRCSHLSCRKRENLSINNQLRSRNFLISFQHKNFSFFGPSFSLHRRGGVGGSSSRSRQPQCDQYDRVERERRARGLDMHCRHSGDPRTHAAERIHHYHRASRRSLRHEKGPAGIHNI